MLTVQSKNKKAILGSDVFTVDPLFMLIKCKWMFVHPNGPELSCGDEAAAATESSPRELSHVQQVTVCFARAKSSTAGSVSLSDWLGGDTCMLIRIPFVLTTALH